MEKRNCLNGQSDLTSKKSGSIKSVVEVPWFLEVMWSDLVQGKPELDDSLSSNAKQMKVASRCFSFWFLDDIFVCSFIFGERFSRKESKTQKRFAGAKQGGKKR